ncbi:MAG: chromosome condensation regulator [Hyperionvirus sp.]|uniref:Chromosome condensation regulator n=1 Tax=Hyperionvirus sp. TaxID=2487770 RepID=A0A3G5A847_9VIRU|nr:MAG: chromosome condensation regulator [Hyperionvirus sp.]
MDLVKPLPIDLQYIVTNYDPGVLFRILCKSELVKYDWFKLIWMNFGIRYDRDLCTNEEIMRVYYDYCFREKAKIACGEYSTIVRLDDGRLMTCGRLGLGDYSNRCVLSEIKGVPKNIAEVVCSYNHVIIMLTDGTLMGCGENTYGQLGLGDNNNRILFCEIKGVGKNIAKVCCGYYATMIMLTDGTLLSCGFNGYGYLGLGDRRDRNLFEEVPGIPKNIVDVVCGIAHTIILLTDGTLMVCGSNSHGQLGMGDSLARKRFEVISGIPKNIAEVICADCHSIIRLTNGTLMSCGFNKNGQIGFGDKKNRFSEIVGMPKNVVKIVCSVYGTMILLDDGVVMRCSFKEDPSENLFEGMKGIGKNVIGMVGNAYHKIIRLADGRLMGYGYNTQGQLGVGDYKERTLFEEIKIENVCR